MTGELIRIRLADCSAVDVERIPSATVDRHPRQIVQELGHKVLEAPRHRRLMGWTPGEVGPGRR